MPIPKDDPKLIQQVIDDAIRQPEISAQLDGIGRRRRAALLQRLAAQPEALWNAAAREIQQGEALEAKLRDDWRQLEASLPAEPRGLALLRWPYGALKSLSGWALFLYLVTGAFIGWTTVPLWFMQREVWIAVAAIAAVLLACHFLIYRPGLRAHEELTRQLREQGMAELRISDTQERLKASTQATFLSMRDDGAVRLLRSFIADELKPLYAATLTVGESAGLRSTYSSALEISTPAHQRLMGMLRSWGGGSIGIAGPRGAGKSTLMQSVCRDDSGKLNGKPTLGVMVAAPVEYQARDFLLYLFASVCHRLLEVQSRGQHTRFDWQDEATRPLPIRRELFRLLLRSAAYALMLSPPLAISSLVLASLNLEAQSAGRGATAASAPAPTHAASASSASSAPASSSPASSAPASSSPASAPPASPSAPSAPSAAASALPTESFAGTASSLLKELDVRPGALLSWAWWLFVLGIGAIAIAQRQASRRGLIALEADERVTRADAATMSKSLSIRPEARELFDRVAKGELESPRDSLPFPFGSIPRLRRLYAAFADPPTPRPEARALQDARRWLVEIKFQQSFTSSWSGALKLAVGAETSLSRGRSLAQQQLTLPEIVDGFTRFLRQVITDFEYTVIVGIDELDKLESDEKAQRFLNEIKAIFGIEGVYYLISVSENAMSNFERRGLPFRDVFDSSFDDVVAVDYLTFADSRRLLNERIVGMPRQFQALCHCLSGGLARELLRTCRDLVEQAALPGAAHDLHALAGSLLRLDLRAKTRAMAFAAERLDVEPQRSDFLHVLHRLPEAEISRHALHQAHLKLMTAATAGWAVDAEKDSAAARLRDLSLEAGSYLYYLATLAELFTAGLDQAAMEWLGDAGIDNIAHALQALAVSPRVTRSLLDDMRLRGLRRPQGDPGFKPA